jgi:hypothetical protein
MKNEPSVLLIDDKEESEAYLRMMDLDAEGWSVECAIDSTIKGAVDKSRKKIDLYDGFSIILLDILWPYNEKYGGIKVLHRLFKAYGNCLPARQVLIVTKGSTISDDPNLKQLAANLNIPVDMRCSFVLATQNGRDRLKKCLLRLWRRIKPKSR